jgi:serine/threonine-protein kinase RsbW
MGHPQPGSNACEGLFVLRQRDRDIADAERGLLQAAAEHHYDETCTFAMRLALEEALANAFRHGNRDDPRKSVTIHYRVDADAATIEVRDEGEGFDPAAVPDPTEPENVEIPCGRGIVLIRAYMTDVTYLPPGNHVRMVFRRQTTDA